LYADSTAGTRSGAIPGRMKFRDVNGDGKIDANDRTFIGNPIPKFILGLNLTVSYRNFDLTAYFNGVFGNQLFNTIRGLDFASWTEGFQNFSKTALYEAGKTVPVLDGTDVYSSAPSSYSVEDGSYLRWRNLLVGYTLKPELTKRKGFEKIRFYVQVQNLFTWTRYTGLDPEVTLENMNNGSTPQRDLWRGFDFIQNPRPRQFIIGFNLEF
jgi:hypothetical protein